MRRRAIPVLLLLALLAAACGQKAGVHVATTGGGGGGLGGGADDLGVVDEGTGAEGDLGLEGGDVAGGGEGGGDAASGGSSGGGTSGGGTSGGTSGGRTGGTGGGGTGGTGGGGTGGTARTGPVWGDTVVMGIHAPLTGAAPLPAASFERGKDLYARYINDKGGIHGRKLAVEFLDDEYQPATAVSKCKQLVEQKKAFLLFGGGGTDAIQACARYAAQVGVPYMSAGVTEVNMRNLKNYFAASMSYPQQAPMLGRYIQKKFPGQKVGMVYSNTKNFYDARDAFLKEQPDAKLYQMSRLPSQSEIAQTAQRICGDGIKVGFVLMAPSTYIALANQVKGQCGFVQWTGVGITMNLNAVADPGCKTNGSVDKGIFFSPFPGVDRIVAMDPEFKKAIDKYNGGAYDDIFIALWGGSKVIGEILQKAGPNLTRGSFVQAAETAGKIDTGVFPPVSYSPTDHFGARQVHILQADCSQNPGRYKTLETFVSY